MLSRWFQVHLIRQVQPLLPSKWARPTAIALTLLLVLPVAALAQNSPFDTGLPPSKAFSPAPSLRLPVWSRL